MVKDAFAYVRYSNKTNKNNLSKLNLYHGYFILDFDPCYSNMLLLKIFENDSVNRPTFEILKSLANLPLFSRVYISVIKDFFLLFKVALHSLH